MSRQHPLNGPERRRAPRHPATRLPSLRASILAGPDVTVINFSRGGLLLESDLRLRPGLGICLNLTLDGVIHVLNGRVSHSTAKLVDGRVLYCVGVALDEETTIFESTSVGGAPLAAEHTIPDPPPEPPGSRTDDRDHELEFAVLRDQLDMSRREREQQDRIIETLRDALQSGERLRQEIMAAHAADRAQWEFEQQELVTRVRDAEEQAASMVQDMRLARDAARRASRQHAQEQAALETRVREREQQLAELRAGQAALLESMAQRLQNYERRDDTIKEQQTLMRAQLANAEAWGTGQQDLLYRLRQQVNVVFELLQGAGAAVRASAPLATDADLHRLPTGDVSMLPSRSLERAATRMRALGPATQKTGT